MRRVLRAVLLSPELWYALLAWILLSLLLTLPKGLQLWAPELQAERGLTAYATFPVLLWLLSILIVVLTGGAVAWHGRHETRSILGAMVAVMLVLWWTWLLYWAVTDLAPILWSWTTPPQTEPQEQSYYINLKIFWGVAGSIFFLLFGLGLGAIGALIAMGLRDVLRHACRPTEATRS